MLATYDFTIIRRLLSSDPELTALLPERIQRKLKRDPYLQRTLRYRLQTGHDIDWGLLQEFIQVPHEEGLYPPRCMSTARMWRASWARTGRWGWMGT